MDDRPRVLLVDDDPDELDLLAACLTDLGVRTEKALSGEQALTLVDGVRFDAAVLDLLMPRLNGFETAARIRQRENGRDLPILILSGYDQNAARRLPGWDAVSGRVEYLEKPFSADSLRGRVAAAYSPAWKRSEGFAPSL